MPDCGGARCSRREDDDAGANGRHRRCGGLWGAGAGGGRGDGGRSRRYVGCRARSHSSRSGRGRVRKECLGRCRPSRCRRSPPRDRARSVKSGPIDLAGRVALVTGASSGIGRGTALMFASRGAHVLAVARSKERLAALRTEHEGIAVAAISLVEPDGCTRAVEKARELGPVAILVHAAGLGGYLGRPIWEETWEAWRATMALNLDAAFELSRLVVPDMMSTGWGRIVMLG